MANPPPVKRQIMYTLQSTEKSEEQNLVDGLRIIMEEFNTVCKRLEELCVNVALHDRNIDPHLTPHYAITAFKKVDL